MIVSNNPCSRTVGTSCRLRWEDSDDMKNVDLTKIHNLSGPIEVEGTEPGDCLVVDILDGTPYYLP